MCVCVFSFIEYLLHTCYVPGTMVGSVGIGWTSLVGEEDTRTSSYSKMFLNPRILETRVIKDLFQTPHRIREGKDFRNYLIEFHYMANEDISSKILNNLSSVQNTMVGFWGYRETNRACCLSSRKSSKER